MPCLLPEDGTGKYNGERLWIVLPVLNGRNDVSRVMCRPKGRCLSFILARQLPDGSSSLPPGTDGPSVFAGIFGLATHEVCGIPCHHGIRWALTPPFHPCCRGSGCFLSHCLQRRRRLSVRKHDALCCPDFPLLAERQTSFLP